MEVQGLPLNTWVVVEPIAYNRINVLSTHAKQGDAEAERDRRNKGLAQPRYSAFMALQPIAERMGRPPG